MPAKDSAARIKLRNLRALQETIATGSMAKAARKLALTQPAVSYAIDELEQTLGVRLVDRTPQGAVPTAYGEALARRSVAIFNELQQGLDDIDVLANPGTGGVRIGATPPMSIVAAAAVDRLIRRHPRMSFHLTVEPTNLLLRELRQRSVELVISRMLDPHEPDLAHEILFRDRLVVIASRKNPLTRRRRVALRDLLDAPWVLPPATGFLGPVIRGAFAAEGLDVPKAAVTTASTYTMAGLVSEGSFLCIHPETMLRLPGDSPGLTALPVVLAGAENPVGLLRLKDRSLSAVASLFVREIREIVRVRRLGSH